MSEGKLYEEGLEKYPKMGLVLGNIVMVAWVTVGTIGCWFLNPIIAWIYLAFALIMVGVVCGSWYAEVAIIMADAVPWDGESWQRFYPREKIYQSSAPVWARSWLP